LASVSSERDNEAASLATRRCYMRLNRAAGWLGGVGGKRRGPQHRGSCGSGCRCWGGSPYNMLLWLERLSKAALSILDCVS
jgi:hypothetical protein